MTEGTAAQPIQDFPTDFLDTVKRMDFADLEDKLPPNCVDLIFTSPPYLAVKFWKERSYMEDDICMLAWAATRLASYLLKPGGYFVINHAEVPSGNKGLQSLMDTIEGGASGAPEYDGVTALTRRGRVIWDKGCIGPFPPPVFMRRPCVPHQTHEFLDIYVKGDWHAREKAINIDAEEKKWLASSIWKIKPVSTKAEREHTLPFPLELADRVVRLFSLPGEVVLDPFCGIGTTCIAAAQNNRHYCGTDTSEAAIEVATQRLAGE